MALTTKVETRNDNVLYLTIVAGIFREKATSETPGAVKRTYEDKGTQKVKWEVLHKDLCGMITGLTFHDAKYGKQMVLTVEADGEIAKVYIGVNSKYFINLAKRLPLVDLLETVYFKPYDFEIDDKQRTGVTVMQGAKKLGNYYWDGNNALNGAPVSSEYDGDWAAFFKAEGEFLIEQVRLQGEGLSVQGPSGDLPQDEVKEPAQEELFPDIDKIKFEQNSSGGPNIGIEGIV